MVQKLVQKNVPRRTKNWLIGHYKGVARALAWIGIFAIIVLSIVPAVDRPVTGLGQVWALYSLCASGRRVCDWLSPFTKPTSAIGIFLLRRNWIAPSPTADLPAKPQTVEEALAELESKVGAKGRRKFEKFLREVAEDEDEDVESK
jgi:hypothetical protein